MGAVTRILKSIVVIALIGTGLLFVSNVVRAQWAIAAIDMAAAGVFGGLAYALERRPRSVWFVGAVMAAIMIIFPSAAFPIDPANMSAAMPIIAIGGIIVLSLLWPWIALAVIGIETVVLLLLTLLSEYASPHAAAAFAAVSIAIYMVSRWLSESVKNAEGMQAGAEEKNLQLEQTLQSLEETVERQRRQVETIRNLQTPLIESEHGVGLLIVVGYCDAARVQVIQADLFESIKQHTWRRLVIDISGADFESEGFSTFTQTLQALRLMISDIVICGISPRLARELTEDGERVQVLQRTANFCYSLREAFADRSVLQ